MWATDGTYLWTGYGWVYPAVVLDLFRRKVTGRRLSNSPDTQLVQTALQRAVERRRTAGAERLHHRDRGCQSTSHDYRRTFAVDPPTLGYLIPGQFEAEVAPAQAA